MKKVKTRLPDPLKVGNLQRTSFRAPLPVLGSSPLAEAPPAGAKEQRSVRYVRRIADVHGLSEPEREALERVAEQYAFRANDYYLSLINWKDPNDPIRQLVIPRVEELADWGKLDASNEAANTVARGVQHKYSDTVLLLCNETCGAFCRYCFRKRLFMNGNDEVSLDVSEGLEYIRSHPEVTNVLLTGGDPLLLSTRRLGSILSALRDIPHVRIIRLGTKMPAFNPWRVLDDPELLNTIHEHSTPYRRIYVMAHFDHPHELTKAAVDGIAALLDAGAICVNQCPLIRGVNDDSAALAQLFKTLSFIGCPQYYLFQGRPTAGNAPYELPIVEGYRLFEEAKKQVSGLAKRVRFAMSHETGKVEVVGVDALHIYLHYHRAKDPRNEGRFVVCHRDDEAYWLDQLRPVAGLGTLN